MAYKGVQQIPGELESVQRLREAQEYGVKGMKWGQRKAERPTGHRAGPGRVLSGMENLDKARKGPPGTTFVLDRPEYGGHADTFTKQQDGSWEMTGSAHRDYETRRKEGLRGYEKKMPPDKKGKGLLRFLNTGSSGWMN